MAVDKNIKSAKRQVEQHLQSMQRKAILQEAVERQKMQAAQASLQRDQEYQRRLQRDQEYKRRLQRDQEYKRRLLFDLGATTFPWKRFTVFENADRSTVVVFFLANNGEPMTFEEKPQGFPSETFITKLRLLLP